MSANLASPTFFGHFSALVNTFKLNSTFTRIHSDHLNDRRDRRLSIRGRVRVNVHRVGVEVRGRKQTGSFTLVAVFRRIHVLCGRDQVHAARDHVVQPRIR